jgi:hypothetical protein
VEDRRQRVGQRCRCAFLEPALAALAAVAGTGEGDALVADGGLAEADAGEHQHLFPGLFAEGPERPVHGLDLELRRAPAEAVLGRRHAAAKHVDEEAVVQLRQHDLGAKAHGGQPRQGRRRGQLQGRQLHARVGVQNREGRRLREAARRDQVRDQRGDGRRILAAGKGDGPVPVALAVLGERGDGQVDSSRQCQAVALEECLTHTATPAGLAQKPA